MMVTYKSRMVVAEPPEFEATKAPLPHDVHEYKLKLTVCTNLECEKIFATT